MKGAGDEKGRAGSHLQVPELPTGWAGTWPQAPGEALVPGTFPRTPPRGSSDGLPTPIPGIQQ